MEEVDEPNRPPGLELPICLSLLARTHGTHDSAGVKSSGLTCLSLRSVIGGATVSSVDEALAIEGGGWVRWIRSGYGLADVRIRFVETPGGRSVPIEVRVADADGVRPDQLRDIPLARLERWVNSPEFGQAAGKGEELPRPRVSARIPVPPRHGRDAYPDSFYRRVADVASAGWSAREIAERSGVPASTVTRWIKGCRERGYLPPARPRRSKT